MNYSTAVMLINENIRAVKTIYGKDTDSPNQSQYTFKTLDASIEVGDLVVVPTDTRHGFTVVEVSDVDVDVDFEASIPLKWIVSRVPVEDHEIILAEEEEWIDALKVSEKRRKKAELKESMMETYGDSLENLPIANRERAVAIEYRSEKEDQSDDTE